jgi:heme/copper-type cytochrome/quinol oxidase subunit 3
VQSALPAESSALCSEHSLISYFSFGLCFCMIHSCAASRCPIRMCTPAWCAASTSRAEARAPMLTLTACSTATMSSFTWTLAASTAYQTATRYSKRPSIITWFLMQLFCVLLLYVMLAVLRCNTSLAVALISKTC